MKVFGLREILADDFGADHLAIALDQAAVRLLVEDGLRDSGHGQRIEDARDDREDEGNQNRRFEFFQHSVSPYARCSRPSSRSMAQMPGNGAMIPPSP